MKKKKKRLQTFENIVVFPGTIEQLLSQAHAYAEQTQYHLANEKFEEALQYTPGDEMTLSVYAYSLYEVRNFEKAKVICERLLEIGPSMYFEAMELYLTVCMQLRQFKQVEKIIESLLEEDVIPEEQLEKFQRLKNLNADIAESKQLQEEQEIIQASMDYDLSTQSFFSKTPAEQLMFIHELTAVNIRPIAPQLKEIIEHEETHPFIKSLLLILLVEQEVSMKIEIKKFNCMQIVNPLELRLPTEMPHFQAVTAFVIEQLEQEPSTLELITSLIAKHAIVTYPFEWFDFEDEDVAASYMDYVRSMFGEVREMDYELMNFLQQLEKLAELQDM